MSTLHNYDEISLLQFQHSLLRLETALAPVAVKESIRGAVSETETLKQFIERWSG